MSDNETYEIPLQDQRVFGAGIKRKTVKFVPSTAASSASPPPSGTSAKSVSDFYLKLVLPSEENSSNKGLPAVVSSSSLPKDPADLEQPRSEQNKLQVCEICNLPLTSAPDALLTSIDEIDTSAPDPSKIQPSPKPRPHEASIVHMVCLTHSHPPSHLDRNRKGLAYLSAYGWDPDSRLGLGASGQGIQYPIKTQPKDDKLGIGLVLPKEADRRRKEKTEKLDAGKVRKLHEKDKKKAQRLREMFYRNDDVERYLGGG